MNHFPQIMWFMCSWLATYQAINVPVLRWDYSEEAGPKTWAKTFTDQCAGKLQSPIDISTKDAMVMEHTNTLKMQKTHIVNATLINTGPLLVINVRDHKDSATLHGAGLKKPYHFAKLTFNWGADNTQGSEHTIDGKTFPLEMKMVFVKEGLKSKKEVLADPEGLAVIAVLWEVMTPHEELEKIVKHTNEVTFKGEKTIIPSLDLSKFVPDLQNFYRYKGSIPVPLCNENVDWFVPTKRQYVSEKQIKALRGLYSTEKTSQKMVKMVGNIRNTQARNKRPIYHYVEKKKAGAKASEQ